MKENLFKGWHFTFQYDEEVGYAVFVASDDDYADFIANPNGNTAAATYDIPVDITMTLEEDFGIFELLEGCYEYHPEGINIVQEIKEVSEGIEKLGGVVHHNDINFSEKEKDINKEKIWNADELCYSIADFRGDNFDDRISVALTPVSYWNKEHCCADFLGGHNVNNDQLADCGICIYEDCESDFSVEDEELLESENAIQELDFRMKAAGFVYNKEFDDFMKQHLKEEWESHDCSTCSSKCGQDVSHDTGSQTSCYDDIVDFGDNELPSTEQVSQTEKTELEKRMYFFTMYNISGIQKGIQCLHSNDEYSLQNDSPEYQDWKRNWKTVIILNGGSSVSMEDIHNTLTENGIKHSIFNEPDLNNSLSSIAFLVDERVFDREKYLGYRDWLVEEKERDMALVYSGINLLTTDETALITLLPDHYTRWSESIGGKENAFLKTFISGFKKA
jgi:hypothetical protein